MVPYIENCHLAPVVLILLKCIDIPVGMLKWVNILRHIVFVWLVFLRNFFFATSKWIACPLRNSMEFRVSIQMTLEGSFVTSQLLNCCPRREGFSACTNENISNQSYRKQQDKHMDSFYLNSNQEFFVASSLWPLNKSIYIFNY